jgi:hypothetical protein
MKKFVILGLLLALGSGLNLSAGAHEEGEWNADASKDLSAAVSQMFTQMDAGNIDSLLGWVDANPVIFDVDPENKFVQLYGDADVGKYISQLGEAMKAGLKTKTVTQRTECHASHGFGYCAFEFDQAATMGDHTMGPFKFRGTLVAHKVNGKWKWAHWHGSFREIPKME